MPPIMADHEWWGVFPADSFFYAFLKVNSNAEYLRSSITNIPLEAGNLDVMLERTHKIFMAVTAGEESEPSFYLLALGNFSPILMGIRMNFDSQWYKVTNPYLYWVHKKNHMKISFPTSSTILLTSGDMEAFIESQKNPPRTSSIRLPLEVLYEMRLADTVLYFPSFPTELVDDNLNIDIPITTAWLSAHNNDGSCSLSAEITLPPDQDANKLLLAGKLIIMSILRETEVDGIGTILKRTQLTADGNVVKLAGLELPLDTLLVKSIPWITPMIEQHLSREVKR